MRSMASKPRFETVTVILSDAVCPYASVAVAVHMPAATPVTVSAKAGPIPVVGLTVAMPAQAVAAMLNVPV